jgi:hypothetical protein
MQNRTCQAPAREALELLPLPDPEGLTEQQLAGRACAWDGVPLLAETAVDLGARQAPDGSRCFPQGCSRCAGERAHRALFEHAPMCEQCVDEAGRCETGRALYRLIREGRR